MTNKVLFPSRLRECIADSGLQQKDLAMKLGMSPSRLSSYVCGRVEPSLADLSRFCFFFEVSSDYLIGITEIKDLKPIAHREDTDPELSIDFLEGTLSDIASNTKKPKILVGLNHENAQKVIEYADLLRKSQRSEFDATKEQEA